MYTYKYTNHLYFCLLFYKKYLCHCADFLGCFTGLTCAIVLISWGRPRRSPPRACLTCWRGTRTATRSSTPPWPDPPSPCTTRPCSPSSSPVSRAYSLGNSARTGRWGGVQCKRGMSVGWGIASHPVWLKPAPFSYRRQCLTGITSRSSSNDLNTGILIIFT